MGRLNRASLAGLLAVSSIFFSFTNGQGQEYCSNQNTGDSYPENFNPYQSNGSCRTECQGYAFAIVQYTSCWCSNFVPAQQVSVGQCGRNCPGFPDEQCGNADENLFGYVALGPFPSGTQGGAPSPTSDSSESSPSQTDENGPQTSIKVITVSGAPVTEFITSTPTRTGVPGATDGQGDNDEGSSSVNTGAIAGGVVGGVAAIAAVAGLVFVLMRRRRQNRELLDNDGNDTPAPRRNTSTLSKTGLLRSRPEKDIPTVIIPAPTYRRGSSNGRDSQSDHASPTSERRNSRPLFYDQRLNPSALMALENRSHTSIATIEDNRDYTRTLNVRNPDPE